MYSQYILFTFEHSKAYLFASDCGADNRLNMTEFYALYGHKYLMTPQEKKDEYKEALRAERIILKEQVTVRKLGRAASADLRTTISNIVESTSTLSGRAGYTVLAFGAKNDYGGSAGPFDLVPESAYGFCDQVLGMPPQLIAMKLETYLLKGGAAANEKQMAKLKELRSEVVERLQISFSTFLFFYFYSYCHFHAILQDLPPALVRESFTVIG